MIIKLEEKLTQKEIEVLIKYARMNNTVKRLISLVKSVECTVKCNLDQREIWVNVSDIYYIESVDKKTFVYCQKDVYRTEYRLYQLIDELGPSGFVQISKACLVNINVLESIRPLLNSRLEATLSNEERIYVTRKYVSAVKAKLQERL
jgi:DNA-binding LytR/AlgR family response regulator